MNRVFHIGGLTWLAATFLITGLGLSPVFCAVAGAVIFAGMWIGKGKLPLWAYAMAAAFGVCAGAIAGFQLGAAPAVPYENTEQIVRGVIVDRVDYGSYRQVLVRCVAEGSPAGLDGVKIEASGFPEMLEVDLGDVVEWELNLSCPERERKNLYANGHRLIGAPLSIPVLCGKLPNDPEVLLARWRTGVSENIKRPLSGEEGAVLSGMIAGRAEMIPPDLRYAFSRTGIAHLLAVSGLHLAILVGLLDCVFCAAYLSRRVRGVLEITAVFLFMALIGFTPSVTRAGIMLIISRFGLLIGREPDVLNSLGFSFILILMQNPYAAFSIGLQLSYLATMGIAAFTTPLTDWFARHFFHQDAIDLAETNRWGSAVLSSLATTLTAGIFTSPLICWIFGQFSIISPLTNLIVSPLIPFALGGGLLCGFMGFFPVLENAARICGLVGGISVKLIDQTATALAEIPYAAVPVQDEFIIFWMIGCILFVVLFYCNHVGKMIWKQAAAAAVLTLLIGAGAKTVTWGQTLELAVPHDGNAIAIACGKQGAIIGAPKTAYEARNLKSFFRDQGIERIVLFVAEKDLQFYKNQSAVLIEAFPVETAFGLEETYGFEAELFGYMQVRAEGENACYLQLELGGLRIVKTFLQMPMEADLLINDANELIFAPDISVHINERYYDSDVLTLRLR